MSLVKFDPTREFHKTCVGAVAENQKFTIRLQIDQIIKPHSVTLCVYNDQNTSSDSIQMSLESCCDGFESYIATLSYPKGLYWYYFKMEGVPFEHYIGLSSNLCAQLFFENVIPWQLSVYRKSYQTPTWLNRGIMYQILVDRFCKSGQVVATENKIMRNWGEQPYYQEADGSVTNRDFFGGTLNGILQKLDYLKSLNVSTIYLNPIFTAYSNHKYDTEDFEQVDSMFGTNEDFVNLCAAADKLGIKIVLDGVFNHVGSSSKYFNLNKKYGNGGAYHDKGSPYRKWFNFASNNSYEAWWGFATLPRLNAFCKHVQEYFCGEGGIVQKWLAMGASGWRLDVVDEIDDSMLDQIVRAAKQQNPDCAIIGEVWDDASNKVAYGKRRRYFEGEQLDSVMNYPLRNAILEFVKQGNVQPLKTAVFNIINNYPQHVRNNLMNIIGTHDTMRAVTFLAGDHLSNSPKEVLSRTHLTEQQFVHGVQLLKLAAVLQYTVFGFPSVYYGDEVGLEGYKDPFCRACYPWDKQNKLLLDFYKRLGELRNLPVFCDGSFEVLVAQNGVFAFEREHQPSAQKAIVAVNRSQHPYTLYLEGTFVDLLCGRQYRNTVDLQPNQAVVLLQAE